MVLNDGYIQDLSVEEAEKILDDLYLNAARARGNGKTRMPFNYTIAWLKIKEALTGIQAMNDRALYAPQSVYDRIVNSPNGVPVCTVDRDLIYIKAIEEEE